MGREIRVDFFQVSVTEQLGTDFTALLAQIAALPVSGVERNVEIEGAALRVLTVGQNSNLYWEGELVRIRLKDIPDIASLHGQVQQLILQSDQGIGERAAFLFSPQTRTFVLERNRHSVTRPSAEWYFNKMAGRGGLLSFDPVLEPNAAARLRQMSIIRKFSARIAPPTNPTFYRERGYGFESEVKHADDTGSALVSIDLSMGHKRGSLNVREIKKRALALLRLSSSYESSVDKIEILGAIDEDGPMEPVDLINYRMKETVKIRSNGKITPYEERRNGVREAWRKKSGLLEEMYGNNA